MVWGSVGIAGLTLCRPTPAAGQDFQAIRTSYESERYGEVVPQLIAYRQSKGRSPQVDYMLGTALCRSGQVWRGLTLLTWIGSEWSQDESYKIPADIRTAVPTELDVCGARLSGIPPKGGGGSVGGILVLPTPRPPGGVAGATRPEDLELMAKQLQEVAKQLRLEGISSQARPR